MKNNNDVNGDDAVAVLGMAFRFPGDLGIESDLWSALCEGRDMVSQVSSERWDTDRLQHPKRSEPGRANTFAAGVLSRVDEFDAAFFGISPREAAWMDPQQRLLLELAWEALENSAIKPSSIAGSDSAVYVGISSTDYGMRAIDDIAGVTSHTMTGNTPSIAANRISYVFDLHGPSLAIDTACSSSLVAFHSACNSLRNRESSLALAGGVSLLLHPLGFVGFTKASMLSADGRCKAFDASGAGYVRGEGGAVFVLKLLNRAIADGDPIQAVIRATGANSDGGRKTGITIPSVDGQVELMRSVLGRSGLKPSDIDYIEAHGTGTVVGDPIETAAIGQVYGRTRSFETPLLIGSVKTNVGHLEPASGMAGLAKAILVLKNRAVPPSLHMVTPNPHIDFAGLNLKVATELQPLRGIEKPAGLVVGVNSFGFGGANAHVLVQEFRPQDVSAAKPCTSLPPLFVSARTPTALQALCGRYAALIRTQPQAYYDIAYGAAFQRDRLDKRVAVYANSVDQVVSELEQFAQGQAAERVVLVEGPTHGGGVAFVFAGNGAQWLGMGRRLLSESSRFSELMTALDALISRRAHFSIIAELQQPPETSRLQDTAVAQPLLFAMQVALTTLLREWGVSCTAAVGHSVGEVAAAWAVGALSLEQAVDVICARSAAQARTAGAGRMAAVGLSEPAAREWLAQRFPDLEIAGVNSPKNITVSGPLESLERFGAEARKQKVVFRLLDLDYAFHSQAMDPIKAVLLNDLATLKPQTQGQQKLVSTVTGREMDAASLTAEYWWDNVRKPVQFEKAIDTLAQQGCRIFIEISPHAILRRYIEETVAHAGVKGCIWPTLRKENDGLAGVNEAALRVHLVSEPAQLDALFPVPGAPVSLPNYPWQRERHWHPRTAEAADLFEKRCVHPLLGWRTKDAAAVWENVLDPELCPWLAAHKVGGTVVFPGTGYVEMALAAAREHFGGLAQEVEELDILMPIIFDGEQARCVRFDLNTRDAGFQILSRPRMSGDEWSLHAVGRLLGSPTALKNAAPNVGAIEDAAAYSEISHAKHYELMQLIGLDYGPSFQGFAFSRVHHRRLTGVLEIPESVKSDAADYLLHPALLDACLQSLAGFFRADIESGQGVPFLPVKVGRLRLFSTSVPAQFSAALRRQGLRSILVDFELRDADGHVVAILDACRFRAAATQRRANPEPACWADRSLLKPLEADQARTQLPSSRALTKALRQWFAEKEPTLGRATYIQEASPLFEAMAVSFVRDAFVREFEQSPQQIQLALRRPESAPKQQAAYLRWMHSVLRQEGLLSIRPDGNYALQAGDLPPAQHIWRTLLRDYPAIVSELVLAARIGHALPGFLQTGELNPDFEDKLLHSRQFEAMLDDSPTYAASTLAVHQILEASASHWPSDRRLRVLEFVAGSQSCAQAFIEQSPGVQFDYVMVHADEDCRDRLRAQYAGFSCVNVAAVEGDGLDLRAQGASLPEQFDIILFRHTLHACANPVGMVAAARRKLARGGLLVIAERHPDVFADFLFGLTPNWWRLGDDGRALSRLHASNDWVQVLNQQEFVEVESFRESANEGLAAGAYLVLGKRPQSEAILPVEVPAASWVLLCDSDGTPRQLAEALSNRLQSQGQRALVVGSPSTVLDSMLPTFDPVEPASFDALLARAHELLGKVDHVVYLSCRQANRPRELGTAAVGLLHLVQAIARTAWQPHLWAITAGGASFEGLVREQPLSLEQAALWGLGRVIMNEHPGFNTTLLDLDIALLDRDTTDRLQNELMHPDGEREVALTAKGRFVPRMERVRPLPRLQATPVESRYRLDFLVPGQLRNLTWLAQPEPTIAPDEVEVRVVATGLNFRDVMYVMGLLPDEAVENGYAGASLGLEFSGVVSRVSKEDGEFAVGDPVMGFGSSCFSSHVVTRSLALTHKPADWSFEAAATVPTVFFTVYYALKQLANVQPGERVLIHGAAGGVGIAAVQLALHLGAEIYATVGSAEKRDFVTLLGADHVFDSRSMDFADDILAVTGGEGVDVVLNSLAGEAIRRNLRVLKPFGRFLELGKRDFFENTPIGLRPFKDNISYFGIDADQLQIARPALAGRLFREVMALFREGVLFPLPYRAYPASQVVDAFRAMQQSRHIGKVVVTMDGARAAELPNRLSPRQMTLCKDSTWLITGGIAGFGLESARWLAERGVGRVVLLGRRGLATPGVEEATQRLKATGAQVEVIACDVTDRDALHAVLNAVKRSGPPITGILHAAAVFDDGLVSKLDADRLNRVLMPKVLGAWNLHSLTADYPLEYFVLYSSVATAIGNAGQANYVAANTALESLAVLRRALGLPSTCIGWGPIGDAGYLTRNQAVKDSLASRMGVEPLSTRQALDMLDHLLAPQARAVTTVSDFDWSKLSRVLPSAQAPRFDPLRRNAGSGSAAGVEAANEDIQSLIAGKSPEEIHSIIQALVIREVSQVLCINADRIEPGQSLNDMGMDSLMGVELALGLEKRFNIQLPTMVLSETPTIERVALRVAERLSSGGEIDPAEVDNAVANAVSLAAQHGEEISVEEARQFVRVSQEQLLTGS